MYSFSSKIQIIGNNPYVSIPSAVLKKIFKDAGKDRGPIQVRGLLNGHKFFQTLVKYSGKWRLYLNTPMRGDAGIDVGDTANIKIEFDPVERVFPMHPKFKSALIKNKIAKAVFEKLSPSRQKEINRYFSYLKTEESLVRNIEKAIQSLAGKPR